MEELELHHFAAIERAAAMLDSEMRRLAANTDQYGEAYQFPEADAEALREVLTYLRRPLPAEQTGGWVSVHDRLPAIGSEVLTYTPRDHYTKGPRTRTDEFVTHYETPYPGGGSIPTEDWFGEDDYNEVTHWQPLPESPK